MSDKIEPCGTIQCKAMGISKDFPVYDQSAIDTLQAQLAMSTAVQVNQAVELRRVREQLVKAQNLDKRIAAMTDSERISLDGYCDHCGCKGPRCECWNDE